MFNFLIYCIILTWVSKMNKINIAIFASGSGTNAENIIKYFTKIQNITISSVFSNNKTAGVIEKVQKLGIECHIFNKNDFYNTDKVIQQLKEDSIDLIILAGFLWLIPESLLINFPKIINIHPALLPKYGGKGMYGMNVHEAVVAAGEKFSGITIHWVNAFYDEGQIIFQKELELAKDETPESLAKKIHQLEYEYFPKVIEAEARKTI